MVSPGDPHSLRTKSSGQPLLRMRLAVGRGRGWSVSETRAASYCMKSSYESVGWQEGDR